MKPIKTLKFKVGFLLNQLATLILLILFSVLVRVVPYRKIERWLPAAGSSVSEPWRLRRLALQTSRAARRIPGATCLPQALASYVLLAARGYECRIRIGVSHGPEKGFRAHATLMSGEIVVIGGGGDWDQFVPLTDLRPGQ